MMQFLYIPERTGNETHFFQECQYVLKIPSTVGRGHNFVGLVEDSILNGQYIWTQSISGYKEKLLLSYQEVYKKDPFIKHKLKRYLLLV